jgi:hypothetical protein
MTETEHPDQPDEDARDVPHETGDEGEGDARDPARESAGQDAAEEGAPREGAERRSTGNPGAAGQEEG